MFNVLGPLINPAHPKGIVLGVAERELGPTFARSLKESGVRRALVVCGREGLDEISCAGETDVWELRDGVISEGRIRPELFGLSSHPLSSVAGGTPEENARTFKELLCSGDEIPEKLRPVLDFVLMNASAVLVVAGLAKDYEEGTRMAREAVRSGKAWEALERFRREGERVVEEAFPERDRNVPLRDLLL